MTSCRCAMCLHVLNPQLHLTELISSPPHFSSKTNALMAPSPWPDDVSLAFIYDHFALLTYQPQKRDGNILVHHETIEALQLRPPNTFTYPYWLYEGNFNEWLSNTYPGLLLAAEVSPSSLRWQANNNQTSSINATRRILNVVRSDFLCRQKLTPGQCRTVLDLLQRLKKGCAAFRLLNLPPEPREIIYGIAMEPDNADAHEYGFTTFGKQLPPMTNRAIAFRTTEIDPLRTASPSILYVNRQVRPEAGKLYFGSKVFEMFIDSDVSLCSLDEVEVWLTTIVGEFATHLRDVRIHTTCLAMKEIQVGIAVYACFHQSHGLQIIASDASWGLADEDDTPENESFFDMPSVVAALEKDRIARGQKGEVIVDFFFVDPKALCRAWYGPARWRYPRWDGDESFDSRHDEWMEYSHERRYGLFHGYDQSMERFDVRGYKK